MSDRLLYIAGSITDESATELIVKLMQLDARPSPITVLINSHGGELDSGLALYDAFVACESHITALVVGQASSAASIALQGADVKLITKSAYMMIHDGHQSVENMNMRDLESIANHTKKTRELMYNIYAQNSNRDIIYWRMICEQDTYFSAEDAVASGLVDRVTKELP